MTGDPARMEFFGRSVLYSKYADVLEPLTREVQLREVLYGTISQKV